MTFGIPYDKLRKVPVAEREKIYALFDLNNHDLELSQRLAQAIEYIDQNYPDSNGDYAEIIELEPADLSDKIPEPRAVARVVKVGFNKEQNANKKVQRLSIFPRPGADTNVVEAKVSTIKQTTEQINKDSYKREDSKELFIGENSLVVRCNVYDYVVVEDCSLLFVAFSDKSNAKNIRFRRGNILCLIVPGEEEKVYKIEYLCNFEMSELDFFVFKIVSA